MKKPVIAIVSFLFICVLFSGCPQPKGSPALVPTASQRIYELPFDRVWDATLALVTEELQYPLEIVERDTGLISTDWVTYQRKIGDYRESEMITTNSPPKPVLIKYRVMVMVKVTPEGTMVRVRRYTQEWIDRWTPVATDLQFERQFLLLLDKRLGYNP